MQATIKWSLSEATQREFMAATGQPVARQQQGLIDATAEDLPYLDVGFLGQLSQDLSRDRREWSALDATAAWAAYRRRLEEVAAERAAERQKIDDQMRAFLAEPPDSQTPVEGEWYVRHVNFEDVSKRTDPLATAWRSEAARRLAVYEERKRVERAEWERKNALAREAKAAAEAEKETAKAAAIGAYVARRQDWRLAKQYAAGLLCREVVLGMMAAETFAAAELPEAVELHTCRDRTCPCGPLTASCLPPEVYVRWEARSGKLPAGTAVSYETFRQCRGLTDWDDDDERAGDTEYHAIVTIPCGPFQFTRRMLL